MHCLTFILLLFTLTCVSAQDTGITTDDPFVLHFKTTNNAVSIECEKGCSWTKLGFNIPPYRPFIIDQNGGSNIGEAIRDDNGIFAISVMRIKGGLTIRGINNTNFTEIKLMGKTAREFKINQNGMI